VLAALCSCGPAEVLPAPVATPPQRRVRAAAAERSTPLGLPENLLLAGRIRDPRALIERLQAWSGRELPLERWLREHLAQPRQPLDLSAPVELFVALDTRAEPPELRWALSFALTPSSTEPTAPTGPRDVDSALGFACAEAPALGPAPLRLVCAASDTHLLGLLEHARRALPLWPLGDADVAVTLRAAPLTGIGDGALQAWVAAWLTELWGVGSINARFDAQWLGLVQGAALELRQLASDLDGSSIQLSLRSQPEALELSVVAPAAAGHSALGRLVLGAGASGLAPVEFWQTDASSEDAGFIWSFESTPLARWRAPLAALLGTLLDFRGVPVRLELQARELLEALPLPRGPVIHAAGHFPESLEARPRPWPLALGWQLYSVRGNFAEYQLYGAALARAFNDPILGPQFGRVLRGAMGPEWSPRRVRQRRPSGRVELPPGSFCLEVTFASAPDAPAVNFPGDESVAAGPRRESSPPMLYVVFAPDEDGAKIAWGADESFLVSLLSEARGQRASATLASRAGLGSLNERRTLAGGFYSLAALGSLGRSVLARFRGGDPSLAALSRAPHAGLSPIVYTLSRPSEDPTLWFNAALGRDTLEDALFLIAGDAAEP
jgi:hypothetical protein